MKLLVFCRKRGKLSDEDQSGALLCSALLRLLGVDGSGARH